MAYSFSWFHSRLLSLYKGVVPIVFAFIRRPSRFSIDLFICVSLSLWVCIISIDGWKHIEHCTREKWYSTYRHSSLLQMIRLKMVQSFENQNAYDVNCLLCRLHCSKLIMALKQLFSCLNRIILFFFVSFCLYFGRLKCC